MTDATADNEKIYELPPDEDELPKPQTNGANGHKESEEGMDEPPNKKPRVSETTPNPPRKKLESPPWKKVVAEGPSSFTQDGKRKSGRVNHIPLELQPPSDKRQTRGAQKVYSAKGKNGNAIANGHASPLHARDISTPPINGSKKSTAPGVSANQHTPKSPGKPASPKRAHRKSMLAEHMSSPVRSHKKSSTTKSLPQNGTQSAKSTKARRSGRVEDFEKEVEEEPARAPFSPLGKPSRIKFRVKPPTIPRPHPLLVLTRPRLYPTLEEFFQHGGSIPVEAGGLLDSEEQPEYTPEQISYDAQVLLRAEAAAEPGGVLSAEKCSEFHQKDPVEIPRQWAHLDHMNKAAINFRGLLLKEQREHRQIAKRLAEACRDEWYRRQPKSLEQTQAEQAKASQARYKSVAKTLQATWDNVRAEVNRRRLLEWEAQEQARVRKALSEAVDVSTQKLQARRAQAESDAASDSEEDESDEDSEPDNGAESGSDEEDRESNMSSTDSEAEDDQPRLDAVADEHLTVEQLREKYAALPDVPTPELNEVNMDIDEDGDDKVADAEDLEGILDESDESVDMDDDMGSSDEGSGSDDEDESGQDEIEEDDEDVGAKGLLGFLPRSELEAAEIPKEARSPEPVPIPEDMEMDEQNEVSLVAGGGEDTPNGNNNNNPEEPPTEISHKQEPQMTEVATRSPDRSSQPTPRTTETRASDGDSASSVELQQTSRQVTKSATPLPNSQLKTTVPFLLRGTLREYQHYGLDWLAGLYANNTNGILADEMGLGKTIQTIALLAHLACVHEEWGPHLVIVPTSVMLNWEMEFKKWCPGFKILTYYGTQEERKRKRLGWKSDDVWNVCITSYQIIIRDQQVFKRRRWHYMILDEAHNIKNFNSQRWQTMLTFNTRARLLLTGTPLQNNLTELWSLLYFLMPSDGTNQGVGGFADLKEFQGWFKKPSEQILEHGREQMDDESRSIIAKLHKLLRPYLLRRLKADVEKQMPAKYEHVEYCRLSKRQRELYDGFLNRSDTRDTLASTNYLSIMNCLMQLRKVCNHPDLFVDRPILTSFPMEKSAVADFEIKEFIVRKRLLNEDPMSKASLDFLNLVPTKHERLSDAVTARSAALSAQRSLMDLRETQRVRAQTAFTSLDPSTARSNLTYLESASRWGRFEELQHCVYLNALRRQQKPIYGSRLVELLTLGVDQRPFKPQPKRRDQMMDWLVNRSVVMPDMVKSLPQKALELNPIIRKFACVTPAVIARDMNPLLLGQKCVQAIQKQPDIAKLDPFHEARMRLSIQFPDKRLLQYDCGKLQTLDKLLRKLQAGGHRALIFTQMTKVLDILEQFLNIHGHKYLRLDGSTKVEQRQVLTERFNNDTRILAFILSSRSGGLGINLTGADTVIFYDLDWNPAMDKQCQDRCHRIGQTRDVHIYRLISEHTIEANILRKANQKRMLDDVVIQEGEFTTDYFNKIKVQDVIEEDTSALDGDAAANAAMDRVLGGVEIQRVLAQAEDKEDVVAARIAEREVVQTDAADFDGVETATDTPAGDGTATPAVDDPMVVEEGVEAAVVDEGDLDAWGKPVRSTDDYMLEFTMEALKDTPVELPRDKSKNRKRDHRSHRAR